MTSRSDRLRAFLTESGPFQGSVTDLAVEMEDPSPNALSASVSIAVKEGWLRRHPEGAGMKAEWLWISEHEDVARVAMREAGVDGPIVEYQEPPSGEVAEPEPAVDDQTPADLLDVEPSPAVDLTAAEEAFVCPIVEPDPDPFVGEILDAMTRPLEPGEARPEFPAVETLDVGVFHDGNVPEDQLRDALGFPPPFRIRVDVTHRMIEVVTARGQATPVTLTEARRLVSDLGTAIRIHETFA